MTGADDPLRYFRIEARELAAAMARDLLRLEAAPSPDLVQRLLRHAHTLKGAARVVRQNEIAAQAHAFEAALVPLREVAGAAAKPALDGLLTHVDGIAAQVAALNGTAAPRPQAAGDEPLDLAHADSVALDALTETLAETVRQVRLARGAVQAGATGPALDRAERELALAVDAAAKLRLVPASAAIAAMERTVRDVARSLGKEARFAATGGAIRLEARVLGTLRGALIQLARNAVAHGIELPAERARQGKPAPGHVTLDIVRRGERVAFICGDDGAGIDLAAVRRVARERGAAAGEIANLDAEGLLQLLLRGGLSTAAQTTQAAGHGIGLDVVRDAAVRLGGTVEVETAAATGTRIALVVPVSLSTVEALLVEAGGAVVALPVSAVRGTVRLDGIASATLIHDGTAVPLTRLAPLLSAEDRGAARVAAVIASASGSAALAAERLIGLATLVVQPLPAAARGEGLVMGAALDADGVPVLVLDPERLVAAARAAPSLPLAAPAPSKPPILVVDDSLTTRMLEQSILESAGFDVDLAVSAEDALAQASRRRYGLFLVDVEMPGMDGFAFVAKTRADAAFRATPALLVSSRNGEDDRRRALEAGASGYIVKGEFDQSRFLDTVRRLAG